MENTPTYFNDDGTPLYPGHHPKPQLCLSCKKKVLTGDEEIVCNLIRLGQCNEPKFECYGYDSLN